MKRFRLFLYGVLTLFVVGVIGAGLVSLFFDLNSLKPTLADAAFEATGRQLAIEGNIELSLFPRPRATATGVRLSNVAGGSEPDVVTIDVASAQVAWLPLLTGTVDVRQIQASGIRVLVEEGDDQVASLAFTPPESNTEADDDGEVSFPNLIRLADITLVRRDQSDDQTLRILGVSVRPTNDGGTRVDLALVQNGERITAQGRFGSLFALSSAGPFPVEMTVQAAASTILAEGTILNLGEAPSVDLMVSAQGPSLAALARIAGVQVSIDEAFTFAAHLNGTVDVLTARDVAFSAGQSQVNGEVTLDSTGDRPRVTAQFRSPALRMSRDDGVGPSETTESTDSADGSLLTDAPLPFAAARGFDADLSLEVETGEAFGLLLNNVALALKSEGGLATIERFSADTASGAFTATGQLDARTDEAVLALSAQVSGLDVNKLLESFNIPGTSAQRAGASIELSSRGTSARNFADNVNATVRLAGLMIAFDDAATLILNEASARFEGREKPIIVSAVGNIRGEAMKLGGRLDPLAAYQPGAPYTFQFTATGAGATADVEVDMRAAMVDGLNMRAVVKGDRLSDLSRIYGADLPPVGPYDVRGVLALADETIALREAVIRVGESDLQGDFSFAFAGGRVKAVADVRSERLDLAAFEAAVDNTSEPDRATQRAVNDMPLNIAPFLAMDAKINLTANSVVTSALRLEDVSVAIASDLGGVRVEHLTASLDGQAIEASGIAWQAEGGVAVEATGEIKGVDSMALLASSDLAERLDVGDLTVSVGVSSEGSTALQLFDAMQGEIVARDLRFAFKSNDGLPHDPITLNTLRIATAGDGQAVTIESQGTFGREPLEIKGALAPLAELRLMQPVALDFSMTTPSSRVSVKGISPERTRPRDLRFSVDAEGLIVREVAYAAGLALDPDGPWRVRGALETTETSIAVTELDVAIGGSDLTGNLSIENGGEGRRVSGRIKSANLALGDFIRVDDEDPGQEPASAPTPPAEPASGPVFSTAPFDAEALRRLDVDVGVELKAFSGRSLAASDLVIVLSGRSGLFALDQFSATLDGHPVTATLSVDARSDEIIVAASLAGGPFDASRLATELTGSADLARRVSLPVEVDIQLQGTGNSPHGIASTAMGAISVTGGKGFIRQKGFKFLDQGLLRQLTPWAKEASNRTNINCFVTQFDVEAGVANTRAMLLDAEFLSVAGRGTIDLGKELLDLTLTPRPKEVRLLDLAVPVSVTGPLNAPSALPTAGGTAKKVVTTLGIFVNPLVLLVPVIEGVTAEKNPCLAALERAKSGESQPTGAVEGAIRGVGRSIGRILGNDGE